MSELKPCPFCGTVPEWEDELLDLVRCPACRADGPWTPGNDKGQAIAAWNTRTMSEWQDIATAEIEGYEQNPFVLVWVPGHGGDFALVARYEKTNDDQHAWFPINSASCVTPTHWMPLPAPPRETQ